MTRQILSRFINNLRGWSTKRKIIVIESDDWGSIRMPSRETYELCLKAGYPVDKRVYERYDALESETDLELLFDLLLSFTDSHGNNPVITANCVVANPDFEHIRRDGFRQYHYELITETFKKYPKHSGCFNLWRNGMIAGIFHPQYHCREHLNVSLFMNDLRRGVDRALFGFNYHMPGCIDSRKDDNGNDYMEAIRYFSLADKKEKLNIYLEGLDLFKDLFGYASKSIIPPNYLWSPDFNNAVNEKGVRYIQGLHSMWEPGLGEKSLRHNYYMGERSRANMITLIRNVIFEPSQPVKGIINPVDSCLSEIAVAFRMQKPAVICSHRVNYIGFIDESNRDSSLRLLRNLLGEIIRRWPDVEFLTSDQLGEMIAFSN